MRSFAIQGQAFEFAVRGDQQSSTRSFISAARLHADQAIFDEVRATDAMLRGDFIQLFEQIDWPELLAVDRNRSSRFETNLHLFGLSGAFSGDTIHCHIASFGAFAGSSSTPPSWLKCQMLRSRL